MTLHALALLCFFLSGASGLVLEVLWTRQLTLVFGSTTLAISTVLSAFMGGLALGSFLAGKFADRLRRPLLAYALAEAGIGLFALVAIPAALGAYPEVNRFLWSSFSTNYPVLSLLRFVAAAALLLVPTTLMGATLPILARFFVQHPWELRRIGLRVGALYALNTFGAVAGTFLAGFILLPEIGVSATNRVAAITDIALAVLVAGISLWRARRRAAAAAAPGSDQALPLDVYLEDTPPADELVASGPAREAATNPAAASAGLLEPSPLARRLAVLSFGISGGTAMVYQVLWTRALAMSIGSSVYSFTIILLAFLLGLSVGAAAVARWLGRSTRPVRDLAMVHFLTALLVALSYYLIGRLPDIFLWLLRGSSFEVETILWFQFVLAALTVLPPTLVMGAVFPLTVRIYAGSLGEVGKDVGRAYAVNTLGAIIGSFAAGFVVLPLLQLQKGLFVAGCINLALATMLLLVTAGRLRLRLLAAALTPAVALAAFSLIPRWNLARLSSGLFRVSLAKDALSRKDIELPTRVLYYRDGVSTTVSVEKWGEHLALKNNGKVDASNGDDMPTQILVGMLPLVLHPQALSRPMQVAIVGYGSGVSVGAAAQFPGARIDVVELEPGVVEAASFFEEVNHRPEQNPRVRIHIGDGRNFLTAASVKYDVIESEPSNPWITGVSNLFTRDFFSFARSRLADDGIFCQWAQLYEMSADHIKVIYRTFAEVFPYVYVFAVEDLSSDTMLVGTNRPLPLDLMRLQRNFEVAAIDQELGRAGIGNVYDIAASVLLTPDEMHAFTAGARVNTDDNAIIEFGAPRDLLGYARHESYLGKIYSENWPYGRLLPVLAGLGETPAVRGQSFSRLAHTLYAHGKPRQAAGFLELAQGLDCKEADKVAQVADLLETRSEDDPEIALTGDDGLAPPRLPAKLTAADQGRYARDYAEVEKQVAARRYAAALKLLSGWPTEVVEGGGQDFSLLHGFLLYKAEKNEEAVETLAALEDDAGFTARRPALLYYLGRARYAAGEYRPGVETLERYLARVPGAAASSSASAPSSAAAGAAAAATSPAVKGGDTGS